MIDSGKVKVKYEEEKDFFLGRRETSCRRIENLLGLKERKEEITLKFMKNVRNVSVKITSENKFALLQILMWRLKTLSATTREGSGEIW